MKQRKKVLKRGNRRRTLQLKDGSSSTTGMLPVDFFVIKENRY